MTTNMIQRPTTHVCVFESGNLMSEHRSEKAANEKAAWARNYGGSHANARVLPVAEFLARNPNWAQRK